jgi:dGTP triphosphohydrolase
MVKCMNKSIEKITTDIVEKVRNGEMKPSNAYIGLRKLRDQIDYVIKSIEDEVMDELMLYSRHEDLIVDDRKIVHVSGRTTYDFKDSHTWNDINEQKKRIERMIKTATKDGVQIIDDETGEMYEPVPVKNSKSYLKIERIKR